MRIRGVAVIPFSEIVVWTPPPSTSHSPFRTTRTLYCVRSPGREQHCMAEATSFFPIFLYYSIPVASVTGRKRVCAAKHPSAGREEGKQFSGFAAFTMPTFVDVFLFRCQGSIPMIGRPLCLDVEKPSRIKPCRISFFLSLEYNHFYVLFQLQLSPSRSAAEHMNGNDTRSCVQDEDEMEMTDFYVGGGSQSVDCEASPPSLQVVDFLLESSSFGMKLNKRIAWLIERGIEIEFFRSSRQFVVRGNPWTWIGNPPATRHGRLAAAADERAECTGSESTRISASLPSQSQRWRPRTAISMPHTRQLVECVGFFRCCQCLRFLFATSIDP